MPPLLRERPWPLRVLLCVLALTMAFAVPAYAFALDHAPTAWVVPEIDANASTLAAPVPLAVVLARERQENECVVNHLRSVLEEIGDRDCAKETGATNPLKRRL